MKILLFLALSSVSFIAFSQSDTSKSYKQIEIKELAKKDNSTFSAVEVMPMFPGGMEGFKQFLNENLKYPTKAMKKNITGKVIINFIVEKDGTLTNLKILKGIGGGCDKEALRVMKLSPLWKAGVQNGRTVRIAFTMPLAFNLEN